MNPPIMINRQTSEDSGSTVISVQKVAVASPRAFSFLPSPRVLHAGYFRLLGFGFTGGYGTNQVNSLSIEKISQPVSLLKRTNAEMF
jgi:hypothetical protein